MNNIQPNSINSGYTTPIVTALLVLAAFTGCRVAAPQQLPTVRPLPEHFSSGYSDSTALNFHQFFPDNNLVSLIDSALQHNTDINIAMQRIAAAEARLMTRRNAWLPAVSGVVSGGGERYGDYTMNGVGNFDTNLSPNIDKDQHIPLSPTTDVFVGLRSSWEIDIWGKLRHLKKAAAAEWMATYEGKQFLITNLVARLSQQYFQLLSLDAQLRIVDRNVALQEEGLEIVKAQKAGGRATELAVQQFSAQVLNTRAIRFDRLQERVAVENNINLLSGRYPGYVGRDSVLPVLTDGPALSPGLPAALLSRRPDIRQAERSLTAASENVQAARAAFLPSLVIDPYIGLNAFTPALLAKSGSGAYGLLGGLTAPVFQQRGLRAQYALANAGNREMVYQYQQRLLEAYSEVATQISAVNNLKSAYRIKQEEVTELRNAVATARDLYLSGYANYLEVITAQKRVLDTELELIELQRALCVSQVELYRALGGGWNN